MMTASHSLFVRLQFAASMLLVLGGAVQHATAAVVLPDPVHRWSFDGNTNDTGTVGTANGTLANGASVVGGRLSLDGVNDRMNTAAISSPITAKTLISWVSLSTLSQGGGSALTLQQAGGGVFDGIVYGERTANQWMNGSNGWTRSGAANNGGLAETVTEPGQVMMAIVYSNPTTVEIYRNGTPYASYNPGGLITYTNTAEAIFGLRHTGGGGALLGGFIDEARIYNQALTQSELALMFAIGPNQLQFIPPVPEPSTLVLLILGTTALASRRRRASHGRA